MSWAAKRKTKREKDAAYFLLDIFDIHIPLIYSEKRKKALIRFYKKIKEFLKNKSPALLSALFSKYEDAFKR
jgi:phage major head subunit gpT-like protein